MKLGLYGLKQVLATVTDKLSMWHGHYTMVDSTTIQVLFGNKVYGGR